MSKETARQMNIFIAQKLISDSTKEIRKVFELWQDCVRTDLDASHLSSATSDPNVNKFIERSLRIWILNKIYRVTTNTKQYKDFPFIKPPYEGPNAEKLAGLIARKNRSVISELNRSDRTGHDPAIKNAKTACIFHRYMVSRKETSLEKGVFVDFLLEYEQKKFLKDKKALSLERVAETKKLNKEDTLTLQWILESRKEALEKESDLNTDIQTKLKEYYKEITSIE